MRVALLAVVALLVAGCTSSPPASDDSANQAPVDGTGSALLAPQAVALRFAVGDYESVTTYEKTFQPTDICFPDCSGNAMQIIDLTEVVPAEAPVELTVTIDGDGSVNGDLAFQDAEPVQQSQEGNQGGNTLSAVVVRGTTGTVELHLFHGFNGRPNTQPVTAQVEVRSVVRADVLVAGVPAAVKLEPGAVLNFSGESLEQAVLITPKGEVLRDVDGPFSLTVPNGTTGDSILMVTGGDATVVGPNITMTARRVARIEGTPHDVASGAATNWEFTAEKMPLRVGVGLRVKEGSPAGAFVSEFTIDVTAPGNVLVVDESCGGGGGGGFAVCELQFPFFGDLQQEYGSLFLDEHLKPGAYSVQVSAQQANGFEAYEFQLQVV